MKAGPKMRVKAKGKKQGKQKDVKTELESESVRGIMNIAEGGGDQKDWGGVPEKNKNKMNNNSSELMIRS